MGYFANHKTWGTRGRKKNRWRVSSGFLKEGGYQLDNISGDDAYFAVGGVPLYAAIDEGEEGEVATDADVAAGVVHGAALAHDDGAGEYFLAVVAFYAEALAAAVTTVLSCGLTFFMCHG